MRKTLLIVLLICAIVYCVDGKRLPKSRSSSRGYSSRKTVSNPSPTSLSNPVQQAPKPSLFGWQEKSAHRQSSSRQPKPKQTNTQSHSYPSSQTGLSGNQAKTGHSYPASQTGLSGNQAKPANSYPSSQSGLSGGTGGKQQESIQKSAAPQSSSGQHVNNQQGHSYPASTGLSGSGSGASYPQQQGGLSGSGVAGSPQHNAGNYHQQAPPPYSQAGYPKQAPPPYSSGNYPSNNYHHPQGPPPPYPGGYGSHGGYGGYGGYGGHGGYNPMHTPQMPGYFGNYGGSGGFGGVSRSSNVLKGVGIAGAGVGTILTGLALWNLARSTGHHHHTVIYDNRGQPVAVAPNNSTEPVVDPILGDLVNCTLTISNDNATEVLAIPCAIATSFTPEADVKDSSTINNPNDNTKCTVTVVTKAGREFMTTIPCSTLLNTAAANNVTEPPLLDTPPEMINGTVTPAPPPAETPNLNPPTALGYSTLQDIAPLNCTVEQGEMRDPINPCFAVNGNITVIPLPETSNSTPAVA